MKNKYNITLGNSQQELIMNRANKLNEEFEESQKNNFHNKYYLDEGKKLGEGQHAIVYECYLKEENKEEKKGNSKLETKEVMEVDSNASELDDND